MVKDKEIVLPEGVLDTRPSRDKLLRKRRRQRAARMRALLFFVLLVGLAIFLMFAPLFNVENFVVEGNSVVSESNIVTAMQLSPRNNYFRTNTEKLAERILSLPYIRAASIKKKLPNTFVITVTECEPYASIPYKSNYVLIDETGKVLEVSQNKKSAIPELRGISIKDTMLPNQLIFHDDSNDTEAQALAEIENFKIKSALSLLAELESFNLLQSVNRIDTEQAQISFLYKDKLVVQLGSVDSLEYKISYFSRILDANLKDNITASELDLSVVGKGYFKELSSTPTPSPTPESEGESDTQDNEVNPDTQTENDQQPTED